MNHTIYYAVRSKHDALSIYRVYARDGTFLQQMPGWQVDRLEIPIAPPPPESILKRSRSVVEYGNDEIRWADGLQHY